MACEFYDDLVCDFRQYYSLDFRDFLTGVEPAHVGLTLVEGLPKESRYFWRRHTGEDWQGWGREADLLYDMARTMLAFAGAKKEDVKSIPNPYASLGKQPGRKSTIYDMHAMFGGAGKDPGILSKMG